MQYSTSCTPPQDTSTIASARSQPQSAPLVMVVDDSPSDALLLRKALSKAGFQVHVVYDGVAAVDAAIEHKPDLILLDMTMPNRDGLETCRILKSQQTTASIPVIFVTAHSDTKHVVQAFSTGGSDYVNKPIRVDEILARVTVQLRLREAEKDLSDRNTQLEALSRRLAETNAELDRQSRTDALTGLLNRGTWDAIANAEHVRTNRYQGGYSILMLDVDYFKSFNDSQGHQVGDECLRKVAKALANACRASDSVGRYGGEEFVILAPETTAKEAATLAEHIRKAVWATSIPHPASAAGRVTVSVGFAESATDRSLDEVIRDADMALYAAKKYGRNLVHGTGADFRSRTTDPIQPTQAHAPIQNATILLVEDNRTNRMVYKGCLEKDHYGILEAENGEEALELLKTKLPDVIIMDVMMPMMDGLECTRRIKADSNTRDIPVIIVSARTDSSEILAGLEAGADEYLTKPVRTTELAVRVRSMVRLSRERKDLVRSYQLRADQIRVLVILVDLCRAIGNATKPEEILEFGVRAAAEITSSRRVSIMLPDADRRFLTIAKSIGVPADIASSTKVTIGTEIAGRVFKSGDAVIANTETEAKHYGNRDPDLFLSIPLLSAPMGPVGEPIGVMNVTERVGGVPFDPRELEYIDLVAGIVGSSFQALRNGRARDEARDLIVVALARLAEHRDNDTARHVDRVARYSRILAESLRKTGTLAAVIDEKFIDDITRAAPLHDIGKVAIPDGILLKPSQLTIQEMAIMRTHVETGAETLKPVIEKAPDVGFLRMAEEIIRAHHEWYDGGGYPNGISGGEIPISARIVALADVYDAITTDRVYKAAASVEHAEKVIKSLRGTQFDPVVVDAFLQEKHEFRRLARELRDHSAKTAIRASEQPIPACVAK